MPSNKPKKITVDLGEENGVLNFANIDEFMDWFQKEKTQFNWVGNVPKTTNEIQSLFHYMQRTYQNIDAQFTRTINVRDTDNYPNELSNLISSIESAYRADTLICSSSAKGEFINSLKNDDPKHAANVLSWFNESNFHKVDKGQLRGMYEALEFEKGATSNVDAEKKSLKNLKNRWGKSLNEQKDIFENLNTEFSKLDEDIRASAAENDENYKNLIKSAETKLEDIAETYDKKLALQSSVDYWQTKATEHNNTAKNYRTYSAWAGVLCSIILAGISWWLLSGQDDPKYWQLAIFAIFLGFGIWLVRILVRIFLSSLHLATDAEERVTMLKTYLALLREGQGPSDGKRELMLQTIFRPAHIGIVGNEGAPPTALDIIQQFTEKK